VDGRVALVTGASTGLGRAIALALAAEGARVAVNYASSQAEADETAAQAGGRAFQADVSDPDAVRRLVADVERELGPVDVLVNNAGTTKYVPFADVESVTPELWERILGVNLVGAFLCVQAVVPGMRERGFGKIVNVASTSAFNAEGSSIPYAVSKAGLVHLTRCLAEALAPAVQVNAVAPGWMHTPWVDKYMPPELVQRLIDTGAPVSEVDAVAARVVEFVQGDETGQAALA
jgi:NAD(P)-dependent dehydrogenase (short-subunit alcohol dehydrogenase family)